LIQLVFARELPFHWLPPVVGCPIPTDPEPDFQPGGKAVAPATSVRTVSDYITIRYIMSSESELACIGAAERAPILKNAR